MAKRATLKMLTGLTRADGTFIPSGPVEFDLSVYNADETPKEAPMPHTTTAQILGTNRPLTAREQRLVADLSGSDINREAARQEASMDSTPGAITPDDDEPTCLGGRALATADDALRFILAGNATITLKSLRTGTHFTYKVQEPQKKDPARPVWFVKLLTGPDNTGDYTYLGMITATPLGGRLGLPVQPSFRATKATRNPESPSFKAFAYTFAALAKGEAPAGVEIRHEGRCGRCGRALTVPESIDRGIGPECAGRMGL